MTVLDARVRLAFWTFLATWWFGFVGMFRLVRWVWHHPQQVRPGTTIQIIFNVTYTARGPEADSETDAIGNVRLGFGEA